MDFRPYGIDLVLKPSTKLQSINASLIQTGFIKATLRLEVLEFSFPSGDYKVQRILGEGTYGITYSVQGPDNKPYAVKLIQFEKDSARAFLKECMIHILLMQESKNEKNGPYVPIFYEVGYDEYRKTAFIRTEMLDGSYDSLIRNVSQPKNDILIPYTLIKISEILDFFNIRLRFNHRDLKGDNIMFKKKSETAVELKLIDFGLSCLTWKGIRINGEGYSGLKSCYKPDRDLSQFLYSLARFERKYISNELLIRLEQILHAIIGNKQECDALTDCPLYGLKDWYSSYNFYNRSNVKIPSAIPTVIKQEMIRFREGKPFQGFIQEKMAPKQFKKTLKQCKKGEIWDIQTQQCKRKTYKKPCGKGKVRNPLTNDCQTVPIPISILDMKPCPKGKRYNPITQRCKKDPTYCPKGQYYNPFTKSCKKL